MSKSTTQNTEAKTSRIQVGSLSQQEKELKNQEADKIKGGAAQKPLIPGEEIPQTLQR